MVFVNEIKELKKLGSRLKAHGVRCEILHGERSQREREDSMRSFKAGAAPVLLTTDLASRGIDIPKLPAVVNFDPPQSAAQYVHRAGRTGRQGASGLVMTMLRRDNASRHFAAQIRGLLVRSGVPLPPAMLSLLPAEGEKRPRPRERAAEAGANKKVAKRAAQATAGGLLVAAGHTVVASEGGSGGGAGLADLLSFAQVAAGSGRG
jgi:superfamily II DNA/RNA helicase